MTDEIKLEILTAWNRYLSTHSRRYAKNEGSAVQHEDTVRTFKAGIVNHPKLSKKERDDLLAQMGLLPVA